MRIYCVGDSITYGFGLEPDLSRRWSDLTARETGHELVNCGINGDSTNGMLARCQWVFEQKPDLLVLLGGINDINLTGSYRFACGNMVSMIKQAMARGIAVIVGLPLPLSPEDMKKGWDPERDNERSVVLCEKYVYWLTHYCDERAIPVADFYGAFHNEDGSVRRELLFDGLHPNAQGHGVMADVLCKLLKEIGVQPQIQKDVKGD